jgi:membrane-associated protease RseP (regulator of RpoE activity)
MHTTKWGKLVDYNLFTTSDADRLKYAANGCDAHSIVGDPQFADPAHGDFTPRNQALLGKIGFQPFPMDQFGVQKPALKRIAKTPAIPVLGAKPTVKRKDAAQNKTVWLDATLAEPKGDELSAYGVAFDSGGVAIATIDKKSPLAGAKGLQSGDLIQGINGETIKSIADLKRVVNKTTGNKFAFKVIRSQSETTVTLNLTNPNF